MVCPPVTSERLLAPLKPVRTGHDSFPTHPSGHLPRLHTTTFPKLFISFVTLALLLELDLIALVLQYVLALSAISRGFGFC
jgi:hypothetical protein